MSAKELTKRSALTLPGKASSTALVLPDDLSFELWQETGSQLQHAERALMWWLGDWWAFGDAKYGERATQATDEYSYQALADAGWVARQFESSRRRESLSFSHHREVAALEAKAADALLDMAEAEGWNRNELRREVRLLKGPSPLVTPIPPEGKFSVILADPPWRYDFSPTDSRQIENQYPTMDVAEICELGKHMPFADDAVLFLWATAPKLREALDVIVAWGFTYTTHGVWDKEIIGMGYWFRGQHEPLLVATRGSFPPPPESARVSSVIRGRRAAHSAKPEAVYELIEAAYVDLSEKQRLEMFAREAREGWTSWGNEVARA